MSKPRSITDRLNKLLGQTNAETGKTNLETIMDVAQAKADSGDKRFARLLKKANGIQAKKPVTPDEPEAEE